MVLILFVGALALVGGSILVVILLRAISRDHKIREKNEKIMSRAYRDAKRDDTW